MYLFYRSEQIHSSMTENQKQRREFLIKVCIKVSIKVLNIYFCHSHLSETRSPLRVGSVCFQSFWIHKRFSESPFWYSKDPVVLGLGGRGRKTSTCTSRAPVNAHACYCHGLATHVHCYVSINVHMLCCQCPASRTEREAVAFLLS